MLERLLKAKGAYYELYNSQFSQAPEEWEGDAQARAAVGGGVPTG